MYSNAEPLPGSTIIKDPYEVFLSTALVGHCLNLLTVVKEFSALCSILLLINHHLFIKSILNPSSQVISMAKEACHSLRLIYDPEVKLSVKRSNTDRQDHAVPPIPYHVKSRIRYSSGKTI